MLPVLLHGCSDYNVGGKSSPADLPDQETGSPTTDTSHDSAPVGDSDSGADTQVDETGTPDTETDPPDEEVPSGRVDVVLLIDVAYFYDCYHADLPARTAELVKALFASGADVAVAIASYDDYQVSGKWFAADGGVPYRLEQQLTTDESLLIAAGNGLALEWGGDGPGTGYEAIEQAAKGDGYDQDCDKSYDKDHDVKPFNDRSSDAFGGKASGSANTATPGTGTKPGVGFREGSARVVVLIAENNLRDKDEGHEMPTGTCTAMATRSGAISALGSVDAKFLGVNAYEFQDIDGLLQEQLEAIADGTGSKIDRDGDGKRTDRAVLYGDWDWPDVTTMVSAIWDLANP